MNIQEGPAFGALIIASGVGYLIWEKTRQLSMAVGIGIIVGILDYVLVLAVKKYFGK